MVQRELKESKMNIPTGMSGLMAKKINLQIIGFQFLVEVLGNGSKKEQFYYNFLESQPDLNFHNVAVQNQMLNEIQFWLDLELMDLDLMS